MDFEWDEEKRLKNIEKHGIDFLDADILFGNPHLVAPGKTVDGEQRWLAIGMIDEIYVTAVFTQCDLGHPHDLDAECKKWRKKKASGGFRKLNWKSGGLVAKAAQI